MSKLANLLFSFELQRRLEDAGAKARSLAAHPGYAATNLQSRGPRMAGSAVAERISTLFNRRLAQSAEMGALPQIYACAAPDVRGGAYYGPSRMEMTGPPKRARTSARARERAAMQKLWEVSEELTGVRYDALTPGRGA